MIFIWIGRCINLLKRNSFVFLMLFTCAAIAQEKGKASTGNTTIGERSRKETEKRPAYNHPHSQLLYLARRDTRGILYGNTCAEQVTHDHHFYYVVMPKNTPGSLNGWQYFWHNTRTSFKLLFKNGPFWKARVRKRIKNCRLKSGDYTG